jgi:hypothetical protein
MDDRELLKFAAEAAGFDYRPECGAIVVDGVPARWNPLEDDGDALRLAVHLNISVYPYDYATKLRKEIGT